MKKVFLVGTLFVLGALTSHMAAAAPTAELTLAGQLVPSACTIGIIGGDSYSLGDIPLSALKPAGSYTKFTIDRSKEISIGCNGATLVGVTSADNRLGSAIDTSAMLGNEHNHGLGFDSNGSKIGAYKLWTTSGATVDGVPSDTTQSKNQGGMWMQSNKGFYRNRNNIISVKTLGGPETPIRLTNATIPLGFELFIADRATLTIGKSIILDGSTTLELYYL